MVWLNQWTYVVDGVELNNKTTTLCEIPELGNDVEQTAILVAIDGDYPAYARSQPNEGKYTFLIAMLPCDDATFWTRVETLRALWTPGVHTLVVQARGMAAPKTVQVVKESMVVSFRQRLVTVMTTVPKPVLV